ncbi:MAG: adenylate/guanylate cyclase domain-containing protein [Proteobacteria bacterium]|nr:adenylate/guanylate cyclase domain-containing protein [Pseudomonadota bacterium]
MVFPGRRGTIWWSNRNMPLWAAALAATVCSALYLGHGHGCLTVSGLDELELLSVDIRFRIRGVQTPRGNHIAIVGLDDRSRQETPELFQSRRAMATLIDALGNYQPRAIGMDLLFDSPEVVLPASVVGEVAAARKALAQPETVGDPETAQVMDAARSALDAVFAQTRGDEILATAIDRAKRIHLGVLFHLSDSDRDKNSDDQLASPDRPRAEPAGLMRARYGEWVAGQGPRVRRPPVAHTVSTSLPSIAVNASSAGAVNVIPDVDGSVRRVHGVLDYSGHYYMPLGLSMALAALGGDASYVAGHKHIRAGDRVLPVTARGEFTLSFLGPQKTFTHVSAADVLAKRTPRQALADKLVLVGYTDTARDKVITPFDPRLDGVEIHATLIHNIVHDELLSPASPLTTLLVMALLGVAITALQSRRIRQTRWWVAPSSALVIIAIYLVTAQILFHVHAVVVDVAAPLASGVVVAASSLCAALATEGREKTQIRAAFSQYVSASLVERLLADPDQATLGGKRRELTVLFSDIRGFASLSEQLEPEILSAYLNEYLTPMTDTVMKYGGMLDKYIGDAIMAVYGAPVDLRDHAERACATALAMLQALEPLNRDWRKRGLPVLSIGIGLNSGPMSVGNMGSEARFDYTVLGDAVNLGARMEGLTKVYRVDVLVGKNTAERAKSTHAFRELDRVRVKGRQGSAPIYQLLGPHADNSIKNHALDLYAEALDAYRKQDWNAARTGFSNFLEQVPGDGPAQVMLDRIRDLRQHPPDNTWDGVFEQTSK